VGYIEACQAAADAQGITEIVEALAPVGIEAEVWQTGGFCMVAAVRGASGDLHVVTKDGSYLLCHYPDADTWTEDEGTATVFGTLPEVVSALQNALPSITINPGSGPVEGASEEQAQANMGAFCTDLRARGIIASTVTRHEADDDGGRFGYRLGLDDGRVVDVEMPGLALDKVRYMGEEGQNIWHFPRLYVDGSSWIWLFALGACEPPEDGEA
jgi:hypothetical protein